MIVCTIGEKGGTGKTTTATGLAACLANAGRDVLLVDSDTQLTASKWQATRTENEDLIQIGCVSLFGKSMPKELKNLESRYQDIVIDTGGRDTYEMRAALTVCDWAVIPFTPGQFDLWTVERMHDMLEAAEAINPKLRALALISKTETNPSVTDHEEARKFIAGFQSMTLATVPIRNRIAFKRAGQMGMSVIEYEKDKNSKSCEELQQLYNDIYQKKSGARRGQKSV